MPTFRDRKWCFTINNPTGWDDADLVKITTDYSFKYLIRAKEIGDAGTPHYQGFVYFKSKKSLLQIKAYLPRAHIEQCRGTIYDNVDYCKKDGDFQEWGDMPTGQEGQANKWKAVLLLARAGNYEGIETNYPELFLRYHSKLLGLYRPQHPVILEHIENEWWYGATGTGKSRELWNTYPTHYQKSLNKWWDGYQNEQTVAIEEWSPKNECTASQLKIWADRYPFTAEIKGGTLQKIRPLRIIVLSNYTIDECFKDSQDLEPIKRRFRVKHFLSLTN